MAGMSGLLTNLIMAAAVLYIATNFVLPMASRGIKDVKGIVGYAGYGYRGYGRDFHGGSNGIGNVRQSNVINGFGNNQGNNMTCVNGVCY